MIFNKQQFILLLIIFNIQNEVIASDNYKKIIISGLTGGLVIGTFAYYRIRHALIAKNINNMRAKIDERSEEKRKLLTETEERIQGIKTSQENFNEAIENIINNLDERERILTKFTNNLTENNIYLIDVANKSYKTLETISENLISVHSSFDVENRFLCDLKETTQDNNNLSNNKNDETLQETLKNTKKTQQLLDIINDKF